MRVVRTLLLYCEAPPSLCLTKHHSVKTYWGSRSIAPCILLTSALDGVEWSASRTGRFTPRERAPGTHWIGGWVGPRAVLDTVVKREIPSPQRESNSDHPIVQPIASSRIFLSVHILKTKLYKTTISPVVLYRRETRSLTLVEEHR
jgi:hypothetical protein